MTKDTPTELSLVESFLNSLDVESGTDDLRDLAAFRRWLRDHQRARAARDVTDSDLRLARQLREALRDLVRGHHAEHGPDPEVNARVAAVAGRIPLTVGVERDGSPVLGPGDDSGRAVLAEVLAAIVVAGAAGRWERMKICPADDCAVVFYDTSKNVSRRWCSMEVCGNRTKTRAYRQRHARSGG